MQRIASGMGSLGHPAYSEPETTVTDYTNAFQQGALMLPEAVSALGAYAGRQMGAEDMATFMEDEAKTWRRLREEQAKDMTVSGLAAKSRPFATTDTDKAAWANLDSLMLNIAEMIPMTAATLGTVGVAGAAGAGAATLSVLGAATEGILGAGLVSSAISDTIDNMSMAELRELPEFKELKGAYGWSEKRIRDEIKKNAERIPVLAAGGLTAATGAITGPTMGRLFSNAQVKAFNANVKAGMTATTAWKKALTEVPKEGVGKRILKGSLTEGGQEMVQEAGETISENVALSRPWTEGVGEAIVAGGVMGAIMGGGAATTGAAGIPPDVAAAIRAQNKELKDPNKYYQTPTYSGEFWQPDFIGPPQPSEGQLIPRTRSPGDPTDPGFIGPRTPAQARQAQINEVMGREGTAAQTTTPTAGVPGARDFVGPVAPARGQGVPAAPDFVGPPTQPQYNQQQINAVMGQAGTAAQTGTPANAALAGQFVGPPTEAEVQAARPDYNAPAAPGIEGIGEAVELAKDARAGLGEGTRITGGKEYFAFTQTDKEGRTKLLADSKKKGKLPLSDLKANFETVVQSMLRDIKTIKQAGFNAQPIEDLLKGVNRKNPQKSPHSAMNRVLKGLEAAVADVKKQGKINLTTEEIAAAAKKIVGPMPEGKEAERPDLPSQKVSAGYQEALKKTAARKKQQQAEERKQRDFEAEEKTRQAQKDAEEDKQKVEAAEKAAATKAKRAKKYEQYKDVKVSIEQPTTDGDIVMVEESAGQLLQESDARIDGLKALLECVKGA